ncbi:MAG: hypothetical protein D5R99_05000 [Methanocalculus sp. MSAO_Arc1]|uniref:hypothetical protein n=1 Tax=Methanocalculus TaxID=71151 RepID=UPI000FF4A0D3|nr:MULTISPECIES: hypothetical protein [unclassified Methanocalculus]MCP1661428.1 hypothetical protein [Methanocalculus sp. AMF5]RQD80403.1 MAG: hypothetical protein D5R99_05000 [Methanocalculus sp. MSAO_Arc1]
MGSITTIPVSAETKEMLRSAGKEGESYDAIIQKLLREVNWKNLNERWNTILETEEFIPLDAL